MAGRPRTPTALKIIAGTDQPCRINANEPKPLRARPVAPEGLNEIEKQAWAEVAALTDNMGILTEADITGLESLAQALADRRTARASLAASGGAITHLVMTANGPVLKARPEMALISDADRRVMVWLARFGLTPADRSRVSVTGPKSTNPFDKF